jgi:hypothetical protein
MPISLLNPPICKCGSKMRLIGYENNSRLYECNNFRCKYKGKKRYET